MGSKPELIVNILTLFPEIFPGPLGCSLAGQALQKGLWQLNAVNIRDFADNKHRTVDDSPYGGGSGMVMMPETLSKAIDSFSGIKRIIYPSPRGKLFKQNLAQDLLNSKELLIVCGRFEGIDQRIIDHYQIEEISIGDYILSGGEIAAITMIDTTLRLLPGVIFNEQAITQESFGSDPNFSNLLEYPHYTKPANWQNLDVPEVLLSGNHHRIAQWRLEQAEIITKQRRPDLWEKYQNKK